LTWREKGTLERVAAIEAESSTTFEIIDPQQPWSATTSLSVRSYGNETNSRFHITLPPGAQWIKYPNPEFDRYRISTIDPNDADPNDADPQTPDADPVRNAMRPQRLLVEQIEPSTSEIVELAFEWEWLPESADGSGTTHVSMPAPTVSDVDTHQGTIDCIFPSSYSAVFHEGTGA